MLNVAVLHNEWLWGNYINSFGSWQGSRYMYVFKVGCQCIPRDPGAASRDDALFLGESLLQEQTSPWELILTKPVSDLKLKIGSILGRLARSVGVATLKRSFSKIGVVPHAGLSPNVAPLAFSLLRLHPTFKSQEGLDIFNPKTWNYTYSALHACTCIRQVKIYPKRALTRGWEQGTGCRRIFADGIVGIFLFNIRLCA